MKKLTNLMKVVFFMMAIFAFVGCPQETPVETPVDPPVVDGGDSTQAGDSSTNGETTPDYSATVSVKSIELVSGGSTTFTVTSKDGTWILDKNSIPNGIEVSLAEDGITYTVKVTGKTSISGTLTFAEADGKVEDFILLPITVTSSYVTLNLKLDEALSSEIETLVISYSTSVGSLEAEAVLSDDKTTAVALLDSSIYQSNWNGFNLALTAKDSSDAEIALKYEGWINFSGTVAELSVAKFVEETIEITFTFVGFEIPGGSLSVKYGHNQDNDDESDDKFTNVEATIAEDGKSAVALFSTNYAKGEYFNGIEATAEDAEGNEIEGINISADWLKYTDTASTSITLTKEDLAKWTVLKTSDETFAGSESYANYVDATEFAGLTITELKVEVTNYAGSGYWASINCAEIWSNETGLSLSWDANISGYSTTITDATLIESYIAGGIYIAGGNGDTATVTVSYASE